MGIFWLAGCWLAGLAARGFIWAVLIPFAVSAIITLYQLLGEFLFVESLLRVREVGATPE